MTKYILNSGGLRNNEPSAKRFIREIVEVSGVRKILMCFFATSREDWENKFPEYVYGFKNWSSIPNELDFQLAFPDTFREQIEWCDAVYIHGGDDHLVQYWLKKVGAPEVWEGKVVATNSASTHAMSTSFWTCDWRQCMDGFGILPAKTIAHFGSEYGLTDPRGPINWQAAYEELKNYGDKSLPIYALKEGEFIIFNSETGKVSEG